MRPHRFPTLGTVASLVFGVIALLCAPGLPAANPELKIIANSTSAASDISADEFTRIFLLKTATLRNGEHVSPVVNLSRPAYEVFLKIYVRRTDAALSTYYRSLLFTGKALMPKFVDTDAETIQYVAKTRGAIGYVSPGASAEGVKTLAIR